MAIIKKPLNVPADILVKYEGVEGQREAFDAVLKGAIATPSSQVPPLSEEPKRPRGRPRKEA